MINEVGGATSLQIIAFDFVGAEGRAHGTAFAHEEVFHYSSDAKLVEEM